MEPLRADAILRGVPSRAAPAAAASARLQVESRPYVQRVGNP
jgi:hypothetical protein